MAAKVTVRVATAADAHDIVELAYLTYRYSFAKIAFYYADQLSAELTTGQIRSFVGRTQEGRIVAHITRMIDPQCPVVAEIGAVMIRPEYRQSSSLLLLVRALMRDHDAHSEQLVLYTADLVTGHILSQKLCAIFAFHPMALKLSTHDRARFLDIDTPLGQRETTLYAVRLQQEVPPFTLCVPAAHGAIAARLFANAGLAATISSAAGEPAVPIMDWSVQHADSAHYVQLTALAWGADFQASFKRILFDLTHHTVATTSLLLPAWAPPPPALDGFLNDQGFFFGGFVHATPQRWFIKYARLTGQRFSFDEVRIHDPVADELKSYVRLCYERLSP